MSTICQPKVQKALTIGSLVLLELVFLAFYGNQDQLDRWNRIGGDYLKFLQLSTAGSVFMLIGFLLIIILQFKYHDYIVYGAAAWMSFALFILLIGMGLGGKYLSDNTNGDFYNTPVAFWFGQLAIYILSIIELYNTYASNGASAKVPEGHIPVATQQNNSQNPINK